MEFDEKASLCEAFLIYAPIANKVIFFNYIKAASKWKVFMLMSGKIKSKVLRDLAKVLTGNIIAQGFAFLTLVIVSRELGPDEYGIFSLLLAVFTFAVQFSDFGVSTGYIKYVTESGEKERDIFATMLISKLVLACFVVITLFFLSGFVSRFFFSEEAYSGLIKCISIAVLFHSFFHMFVIRDQALQNFKRFSVLNVSHNLLKMISVVILAISFPREVYLESFIMAYSFSVLVLVVWLLSANVRDVFLSKPDFEYFLGVYKLSFWVFLSSVATLVMMRLDILMLQRIIGSDEAGYYSAAMNLAMIFPLITASLVATLHPKLNSFLRENSVQEYVKKIMNNAKYLFLVLLVIEVASPFLIPFVFGEEYEGSVHVFQILLVAFTFGVIVNPISLVIYYFNKAYMLTLLNFLQLPVNFFGNILLIPLMQAEGAAISTVSLNLLGGIFIYFLVGYYGSRYKKSSVQV